MYTAAAKGVPVTLLDEVTTGLGTKVAVPISSDHLIITLRGAGAITGGTLSIKEASAPDYAGDWSIIQINEIDTIPATELDSDVEKIIHIFGTFRAITVDVVSDITGGGDVSAELVCN
jgi:hypothetical protein